MSNLSGYDSEVVGFESVSQNKRSESTSGTQTSEYSEIGVASQTNQSTSRGISATPDDLDAKEEILREYPPPGLNEFLRRVVPSMLEQLDENEKEVAYNSSDSEEEEVITSKLLEEFKVNDSHFGTGDQTGQVLGISWSSAGNSLAVSLGHMQHEIWCEHTGVIKLYTVKHAQGDSFVHTLDISEKSCVTTVKFHHSVAALLAYGTNSGEVVLCNLRNFTTGLFNEDMQLTSPSGCHGSRRVTSLYWADAHLTNHFLIQQINSTKKRRGASDQVLISSGSDGTINVWQVNINLKIFSNIVCYNINGSRKQQPAPEITCFDFIKSFPLRPSEEKMPDDIFVVGTNSGKLFLCKTKDCQVLDSGLVDPVYDMLEGHHTCVLDVAFNFQKPGLFVSVSMDSELRVYDVNQLSPLKVISIDEPVSTLSWLPNNPSLVILGLAKTEEELLRVYNISSGRLVKIDGFGGNGCITCIAVSQSGSCRIAAGDTDGAVRVWELPTRRIRLTDDDLEF